METATDNTERRSFPRVTAPVFFRVPRLFTPKRRVADISPRGIKIFSNEYVPVGKRLEVELFLPSGTSVEAIARVVWIKELAPDSDASYDIGLEFIRLTPSAALADLQSILE